VPGDDAHSLTDAELRTYAAEIAVLGGLAASAECRYERFRESNVVIAGCGLLLPAVAGALLRMGLARPRGAVVDGPPTDLARLREHLALLRRNDDRLTWSSSTCTTARRPGGGWQAISAMRT
jgi:hypothetical protein